MSTFRHDRPGTPAADWAAREEWAGVPALDLSEVRRVVVAAAHPDDESLGAGGLISSCRRAGLPVSLVLVTLGERSHPRSPTTTATQLAQRRRVEAETAWSALGGAPDDVHVWGLPDGDLSARRDDLVTGLVTLLGDARDTLLVTPWARDGHPDHDALGAAGRQAAYRTGARHLQYPVWFWHHADPSTAPWTHLVRLVLSERDTRAKRTAVAAHASQVGPLSPAPGDETLIGPEILEHFTTPAEVFVVEPPGDDALDELHVEHADPWGTETRWYEQRKRELVLAMLPQRRYARGLDVGCSTGTTSAVLADRCETLVAVDRSRAAVRVARKRLEGHVDVRLLDVPGQWPEGAFDLVVISESGYFLSPVDLDHLVARVETSLTDGGTLVLAHWRHPVVGWPLSGPRVHERFAASLPRIAARYVDRDVEIVVHGPGTPSPSA